MKCLYSKFFWSLLSSIQTEYAKIGSISLYSVEMLENADQQNSKYRHFSRSAWALLVFFDDSQNKTPL